MNLQNIKMNYNFVGSAYQFDATNAMSHYKVTLKYNNKSMTIDYYMGKALTENDLTTESVINSLLLDDVSELSFSEFCHEYGYDNDAISKNTYKQCQNNTKKLYKMFTTYEIQELQELLQDY